MTTYNYYVTYEINHTVLMDSVRANDLADFKLRFAETHFGADNLTIVHIVDMFGNMVF